MMAVRHVVSFWRKRMESNISLSQKGALDFCCTTLCDYASLCPKAKIWVSPFRWEITKWFTIEGWRIKWISGKFEGIWSSFWNLGSWSWSPCQVWSHICFWMSSENVLSVHEIWKNLLRIVLSLYCRQAKCRFLHPAEAAMIIVF